MLREQWSYPKQQTAVYISSAAFSCRRELSLSPATIAYRSYVAPSAELTIAETLAIDQGQ